MSVFSGMRIFVSGLIVESLKMDIILFNVVNINVIRGLNGEVYRRKVVLFEENYDNKLGMLGVKVIFVEDDKLFFKKVYDLFYLDVKLNGYVEYLNVNILVEMIDLIIVLWVYDFNVDILNV